MRQIRLAGKSPRIEVLAHGLKDSETALRIEAAAMDLLGLPSLANQVRGWHSLEFGRLPLSHLIAIYSRRRVTIRDPVMLIRINQNYRANMSPVELYDATRGIWRVGPKRERAKYALAVFEGIVREVYEIKQWFPADSTFNTRDREELQDDVRWEFVGQIAPARIRKRYRDGYVGHYIVKGNRGPIVYVKVP